MKTQRALVLARPVDVLLNILLLAGLLATGLPVLGQ
jgi:hypothetical protein